MATNVFELFAKLGLDSSEYESGLGRARSMFSSVGGALGAGVTALAGATTAAVGAAATGVVNLTTQAVNAYGEYEQLTGGISKLFGTAGMDIEQYAASVGSTVDDVREQFDSLTRAEELMGQNAANAYATAGVSANEYMQTVTSFSAALINSLGGDTEEAARIADIAMQDLSDNANTFGTMTAQELANVYSGLARGNFTLLDNLNLGFAGSQEGMLNLLNASGLFEEELENLDGITFDQMLLAIHEVQDSMGIAGTTANEAMGTIQGSMGMLQGAWQNLLTGLGDADADLGSLVDNVVTSAMAVVNNITPIAQRAMEGIASLLTQLAPVLEQQLPSMIETVLPALITAVTSIIMAVAQALPQIARVLLPQISSVVSQILPVLLSLIPSFISIGGEIIGAVIRGLVENAGEITQAGLDVLQTLIDGFSEASNGEGLSQLVDTTMQIVEMIGTFLVDNAPTLITAAVELITQLASMLSDPSNLQMLIDLSLQLILALADGLVQAMPMIAAVIPQIMANSIQVTIAEFPKILETVGLLLGDLALLVFDLIGGMMGMSHDEIVGSITAIGDYVSQSFSDFITGLTEWITNVGNNISEMWTNIKDWFTNGISDAMTALGGWWDEISEWFTNLADNALTWAGDMVTNFVSGITNGISSIGSAMSGFAETVASYIHFSEPDVGELSNFSTFAPDMVDLFATGIEDSLPMIENAMGDMSSLVADSMPTMGDVNVNNLGGVVSLPPIVVQAYFGNEKFDEYMVNSNQRIDFISGGRA